VHRGDLDAHAEQVGQCEAQLRTAQQAVADHPDAITGGLRRTVDSLRAVTERTRGDVTTTVLQTRLQRAIESTPG